MRRDELLVIAGPCYPSDLHEERKSELRVKEERRTGDLAGLVWRHCPVIQSQNLMLLSLDPPPVATKVGFHGHQAIACKKEQNNLKQKNAPYYTMGHSVMLAQVQFILSQQYKANFLSTQNSTFAFMHAFTCTLHSLHLKLNMSSQPSLPYFNSCSVFSEYVNWSFIN